jgi:hypothetical protein
MPMHITLNGREVTNPFARAVIGLAMTFIVAAVLLVMFLLLIPIGIGAAIALAALGGLAIGLPMGMKRRLRGSDLYLPGTSPRQLRSGEERDTDSTDGTDEDGFHPSK